MAVPLVRVTSWVGPNMAQNWAELFSPLREFPRTGIAPNAGKAISSPRTRTTARPMIDFIQSLLEMPLLPQEASTLAWAAGADTPQPGLNCGLSSSAFDRNPLR